MAADDLEVKSFNAATSAYDITEHVEPFTVDADGYASDTMQHDSAGNLTYDGVDSYAYDAWNRLITVAHAWRDDSGTLHTGQVFETMTYDGQGRRIVKAITGTGQFDCTYHYYYDQDKAIETRNGSDQTLKQQVWGVQYVDELVQVALNANLSTDNICETAFWAMQDVNWNVLGIVDDSGILTERYEYTPYGQRTVFFSAAPNDPGCYAPTLMSREFHVPITRPGGLCEFGHQGLMHDELTGLIYNRARMLHPVLGRFMQRDPLGYVDGESLYQYERGNPINLLDAPGTDVRVENTDAAKGFHRRITVDVWDQNGNKIGTYSIAFGLLNDTFLSKLPLVGGDGIIYVDTDQPTQTDKTLYTNSCQDRKIKQYL